MWRNGGEVVMTGVLIFSALLATITTTGLYTLNPGPGPKHRYTR
jgi:hypothetical protein